MCKRTVSALSGRESASPRSVREISTELTVETDERTDRDADVYGSAPEMALPWALHRVPRNADHMCTIFMQGP